MPDFDWHFTLLLITNGVMIGLMYTLIALGFVLVYKATDAINFAQGEFVMFAGFIAAAASYFAGLSFWICASLAIAAMAAFGFGLERVVLRPLIGRPVIAVIMATIGVAAVLRGSATLAFGAGTRAINMPVSDDPIFLGPVMFPPVELVGAGVSLVFLAAFTWFFLRTRMGVAMRAVADSQQVAMAMGINVRRTTCLHCHLRAQGTGRSKISSANQSDRKRRSKRSHHSHDTGRRDRLTRRHSADRGRQAHWRDRVLWRHRVSGRGGVLGRCGYDQ